MSTSRLCTSYAKWLTALLVLLVVAIVAPLVVRDPLDLRLASPATGDAARVPILMYHYVDDAPPAKGRQADYLTVRRNDFEWEMDWLQQHGFHTVTLVQVHDALAGGPALPAKPVVLTFDDGTLDNYTVAYPILRRHGFIATFFVITAFVGRSGTMTWAQLREMQRSGMVVGSHSERHPYLTTLSAAALRQELQGSRETIRQQLGRAPSVIAYPYGYQDRRVVDATEAAGYTVGVIATRTTGLFASPSYTWPRISMGGPQDLRQFMRALGLVGGV